MAKELEINIDGTDLKFQLNDIESQLIRIKDLCGEIEDAPLMVQRLDVKPGDKVIFQIDQVLSEQAYKKVKESLKRFLGEGITPILLEDGMHIKTVLSQFE